MDEYLQRQAAGEFDKPMSIPGTEPRRLVSVPPSEADREMANAEWSERNAERLTGMDYRELRDMLGGSDERVYDYLRDTIRSQCSPRNYQPF